MSFDEKNGSWFVVFWESDRTQLPRHARFNSDEGLMDFIRRAGGPKTLEDKNILAMLMAKGSGEITPELTDEQYYKLRKG
jgi:hypothetical protein